MPLVGNAQYGFMEAPFDLFRIGHRLVLLRPPMFLRRLFPDTVGCWPKVAPPKTCEEILKDVSSPYVSYGICKTIYDAREEEPVRIDIRELDSDVDYFREATKMLEFWAGPMGKDTRDIVNAAAELESLFNTASNEALRSFTLQEDNRILNEDGKIHHTKSRGF